VSEMVGRWGRERAIGGWLRSWPLSELLLRFGHRLRSIRRRSSPCPLLWPERPLFSQHLEVRPRARLSYWELRSAIRPTTHEFSFVGHHFPPTIVPNEADAARSSRWVAASLQNPVEGSSTFTSMEAGNAVPIRNIRDGQSAHVTAFRCHDLAM